MEEILHQLVPVGSLSPLFTAFYTSERWLLFGISEPSTGWFPLLKPGKFGFQKWFHMHLNGKIRRGSRGNWTQKIPQLLRLDQGTKWFIFLMRTQGGFLLRMKSKPRRDGTTFLCCPFVNWKQDCFVNSLFSSIALFYKGIWLRTTNCDWK